MAKVQTMSLGHRRICEWVAVHPGVTRAGLVGASGLSRSGVKCATQVLVARGYLVTGESRRPLRFRVSGRPFAPSATYRLNAVYARRRVARAKALARGAARSVRLAGIAAAMHAMARVSRAGGGERDRAPGVSGVPGVQRRVVNCCRAGAERVSGD